MPQEHFQACKSHKTTFVSADSILECSLEPEIEYANLFVQSTEIRDPTRKPNDDGMDHAKRKGNLMKRN